MRQLSAEMLTAQAQPVQRPYVDGLICTAARWGVEPLASTVLHSEAGPGEHSAACIAADGSLCRMRITAAGDLYVQRVASPAAAQPAAWTAWTLLASGAASAVIPPAMGASAALVNLAYVRPDGYTLVRRFSQNNGATWSSEQVVVSDASAPVRAGAIAARPGADDRMFMWASGPNAPGTNSVKLYYRILAGTGAWGPLNTSTLTPFRQVEGLAVHHDGDWHAAVCGQSGEGGAPWGVFLALVGDGYSLPAGSWAGLGTVQRADAESGYRYSYPSLVRIGGASRCSYWARRPGGPDRLELAHHAAQEFSTTGWTSPAPSTLADERALLLSAGSMLILAGERSAWSASADGRTLDLTSRLLSYTLATPGGLQIVLNDSDGAFGSAEMDLLAPGAGIRLSRGLITPAGPLSVPAPEHEVASVERRSAGREARVRCTGALEALDGWRAPRAASWSREYVYSILAVVCGYAGLELAVGGSLSTQAQRAIEYVIRPGENAEDAVRRLLELIPERLRPVEQRLALAYPEQAQPAYAYGAGAHPLLEWGLGRHSLEPSRVQVYGGADASVYGEAADAEASARGGERLAKLYDPSAIIPSEAAGRAEAQLLAARRAALTGSILSLPNLGLELWDRITVQPDASAARAAYTVAGIEERLDPQAGEWSQTVTLAGPAS